MSDAFIIFNFKKLKLSKSNGQWFQHAGAVPRGLITWSWFFPRELITFLRIRERNSPGGPPAGAQRPRDPPDAVRSHVGELKGYE